MIVLRTKKYCPLFFWFLSSAKNHDFGYVLLPNNVKMKHNNNIYKATNQLTGKNRVIISCSIHYVGIFFLRASYFSFGAWWTMMKHLSTLHNIIIHTDLKQRGIDVCWISYYFCNVQLAVWLINVLFFNYRLNNKKISNF